MFIGRKKELEKLEKEWRTGGFGMPVIYGRRRVGKTAILEQFARGKDALFFTPVKDRENNEFELRELAHNHGIETSGESIAQILEDIFKAANAGRILFIIDEYPYLEESNPGTSSMLQRLIDKNSDQSRLFLVLCGSSMSFMKNQVLGYESPIFGRRTSQFLIETFTLFESLEMLPDISLANACEFYGLVDGTPAYLSKLNCDVNLRENLLSAFLDPACYLFEEAGGLLQQELKNPRLYNSLLNIVGSKTLRIQQISDKLANLDVDKIESKIMVEKLNDIGILKKVSSWGEPKKTAWQIDDCYFRFWHTFMPKVGQAVRNNQAIPAADFIEKHFSEYMGSVFEKICAQWLAKESALMNLPVNATNFGKWWGTDNTAKKQAEVDIVASDFDGNMIFGECKWQKEPMEADQIDKLIYRASIIKKPENCKCIFYLFSKSGFSPAAIKKASEMEACELIDLMERPRKTNSPQALCFKP